MDIKNAETVKNVGNIIVDSSSMMIRKVYTEAGDLDAEQTDRLLSNPLDADKLPIQFTASTSQGVTFDIRTSLTQAHFKSLRIKSEEDLYNFFEGRLLKIVGAQEVNQLFETTNLQGDATQGERTFVMCSNVVKPTQREIAKTKFAEPVEEKPEIVKQTITEAVTEGAES